ncbi:MAG: glycosyltransferase family 4 protein [Chitinispirillaceae bacterium]|nr:glycosyltransferase family 4 protein [Chitinispirillaceae bacterium]
MRIWFASSISKYSWGGVYRSITLLASEIRKYGHKVEIFFAREGKESRKLGFSLMLAMRLLLQFWKRPDWIIARSWDGFFSLHIAKLFQLNTKFCLYSHGWEERVSLIEERLPPAIITNPTTWKAKLIGFSLLRNALKKSSLCICGTIDEAKWLRKRYKKYATKIVVVPNGVIPFEKPFWTDKDYYPPSFLMIGGFTWKKNLEYGIELFRRILEKEPSARLFLIGCGNIPENKKGLFFNLKDSVFTVDKENPEKMIRWYETCPFLILPSRYEGGRPFSILEAFSRGCIVFASDIPSIRECIIPYVNGFLLSGINPIADVNLILKVYKNKELMKRIGFYAWRKSLRNSIYRQGKRLLRNLLIQSVRDKEKGG